MGYRHFGGPHHMMGYGNYNLFWLIIIGILLLIIIFLVYKLAKKNNQTTEPAQKEDQAMHILRERYAKGEISDEEFQEKKKILDEQ